MEEKSVPYYAHEGMMVRMERTNHRLWIMCIVLIIALVGTNLGWVLYESQWEVYEETVQQEVTQTAESDNGDAVNKFVGGDYVEGDSDNDNNDN